MRSTPQLLGVAAVVAVLTATTGCGNPLHTQKLPQVAVDDMRARVRAFAEAAVGGRAALPTPSGLGPAPCSDSIRDTAGGGRYFVTGTWQVPVTPERHRATLRALHQDWRDRGYQVTEYRELPDGVTVVMSADDPTSGFSVSVISSSPPVAFALNVDSPCVRSPDGRYPT